MAINIMKMIRSEKSGQPLTRSKYKNMKYIPKRKSKEPTLFYDIAPKKYKQPLMLTNEDRALAELLKRRKGPSPKTKRKTRQELLLRPKGTEDTGKYTDLEQDYKEGVKKALLKLKEKKYPEKALQSYKDMKLAYQNTAPKRQQLKNYLRRRLDTATGYYTPGAYDYVTQTARPWAHTDANFRRMMAEEEAANQRFEQMQSDYTLSKMDNKELRKAAQALQEKKA